MLRLREIFKKEFKLVFRDIHSVVVLFVMPVVFIMIMSLALQNAFAGKSATSIKVAVADHSQNKIVKNLLQDMDALENSVSSAVRHNAPPPIPAPKEIDQ